MPLLLLVQGTSVFIRIISDRRAISILRQWGSWGCEVRAWWGGGDCGYERWGECSFSDLPDYEVGF